MVDARVGNILDPAIRVCGTGLIHRHVGEQRGDGHIRLPLQHQQGSAQGHSAIDREVEERGRGLGVPPALARQPAIRKGFQHGGLAALGLAEELVAGDAGGRQEGGRVEAREDVRQRVRDQHGHAGARLARHLDELVRFGERARGYCAQVAGNRVPSLPLRGGPGGASALGMAHQDELFRQGWESGLGGFDRVKEVVCVGGVGGVGVSDRLVGVGLADALAGVIGGDDDVAAEGEDEGRDVVVPEVPVVGGRAVGEATGCPVPESHDGVVR